MSIVSYQRPLAVGSLASGINYLARNPQVRNLVTRGARSTLDMARRYYRTFQRSARAARVQKMRSRNMTSRRMPTTGRGVTVQHDRVGIYRKKSMPRRRRKVWKRFTRKVHAIAEKELGSRTYLLNQLLTFNQTSSGKQVIGAVALYPQESTDLYMNDLNNLSALENQGNPTAAAGITVDPTTKIIFKSAVMDLTIRNTSNDGTGVLLPDYALELDIYEITVGKPCITSPTSPHKDLLVTFARGALLTQDIAGVPFGIDLDDRGCTPWELPFALSRYKIKILKKTKLFLSINGTATYQIRDPKRHVASIDSLENTAGHNRVGWTRHVLFIAKPIPGLNVTSALVPEISVGLTKKYLYKVEGANETRDTYN